MKIKTFPLKYLDTDLDEIGTYAAACKMTKEEYIKTAVDEKNVKTKTKYMME